MTDDQLKMIREEYLSFIKESVKEDGRIDTHISIFADIIDSTDGKPALIHIPIADEFLKDEHTKQVFVDDFIPRIAKEFKKKFIPHSVIFTSEAWIRTASTEEEVDNFKDIPIKMEAVVVIIDSKDKTDSIVYEIKRPALSVSETGELAENNDNVELVEVEEMGGSFSESDSKKFKGRFSNLYKKFAD